MSPALQGRFLTARLPEKSLSSSLDGSTTLRLALPGALGEGLGAAGTTLYHTLSGHPSPRSHTILTTCRPQDHKAVISRENLQSALKSVPWSTFLRQSLAALRYSSHWWKQSLTCFALLCGSEEVEKKSRHVSQGCCSSLTTKPARVQDILEPALLHPERMGPSERYEHPTIHCQDRKLQHHPRLYAFSQHQLPVDHQVWTAPPPNRFHHLHSHGSHSILGPGLISLNYCQSQMLSLPALCHYLMTIKNNHHHQLVMFWTLYSYSKSPTYEPPHCQLSKMQTCVCMSNHMS